MKVSSQVFICANDKSTETITFVNDGEIDIVKLEERIILKNYYIYNARITMGQSLLMLTDYGDAKPVFVIKKVSNIDVESRREIRKIYMSGTVNLSDVKRVLDNKYTLISIYTSKNDLLCVKMEK